MIGTLFTGASQAARLMNRSGRFYRGLLLALAGIIIAACGGSSDKQASGADGASATGTTAAKADQPFGPVVASSELVVGSNRFALGIIDNATGNPLPDAAVHFRFFTLQGNQGTLRSEADGTFVAPGRDAGLAATIPHRHPDGTIHQHTNAEADVVDYVSTVQFDQPGKWGVEATFRAPDGREGKLTAPFDVQEKSTSPAIGSPAPHTKNPTAHDVKDLSEIDSAADPDPALHQESVADAIAQGKPALVGFITPGYCSTRFCGPVYGVVQQLIPTYGDKAALIHIEIYKDPLNKVLADPVKEWHITTEPYIFIVDRKGNIAAKFEGPVSLAELDNALKAVTS
jgi:hypothetical protein